MRGEVLAGIEDPNAQHLERLSSQPWRPRIAGVAAVVCYAAGVASQLLPRAQSWNEFLFYPALLSFVAWFVLRLRTPGRATRPTLARAESIPQVSLTPANSTGPFVSAVVLFVVVGFALPNTVASAAIVPPFIALFWLLGRRRITVRPDEVEIVNYFHRQSLRTSNEVERFDFVVDPTMSQASIAQMRLHIRDSEPIIFDGKWSADRRLGERFVHDANVVLGVDQIQDGQQLPTPPMSRGMDGTVLVGNPDPNAERLEQLRRPMSGSRRLGKVVLAMWLVTIVGAVLLSRFEGLSVPFGLFAIATIAATLHWSILRLVSPGAPIRQLVVEGVPHATLRPSTTYLTVIAGIAIISSIIIGTTPLLPAAKVVLFLLSLLTCAAVIAFDRRRHILVLPHQVVIVDTFDRKTIHASDVHRLEFAEPPSTWGWSTRKTDPSPPETHQIVIHRSNDQALKLTHSWVGNKRAAKKFIEDANIVLGVDRIQDDSGHPSASRPKDQILR